MTTAIDRVAGGEDLSAVRGCRGARPDHVRRTPATSQTAALPDRAAHEGRDGLRAGRPRALDARATRCRSTLDRHDLVDTAGTGGGTPTFNVSTTAAFVACGAGCAVAKHGNRSATSKCGSADLLEALGAKIELRPEAVAKLIEEVGFGFMFAPVYHRRDEVRGAGAQAARGAYRLQLPRPADQPGGRVAPADRRVRSGASRTTLANALAELGTEHSMVVHGMDRLDELSATHATRVTEIRGSEVTSHRGHARRARARNRRARTLQRGHARRERADDSRTCCRAATDPTER